VRTYGRESSTSAHGVGLHDLVMARDEGEAQAARQQWGGCGLDSRGVRGRYMFRTLRSSIAFGWLGTSNLKGA
jgi:hypothetical protein